MQLNYQIPDDLHRAVKVEAAKAGITLKEWVEQALRAAVERSPVSTK